LCNSKTKNNLKKLYSLIFDGHLLNSNNLFYYLASLDRLKELASAVTNSTWTLNTNFEIPICDDHQKILDPPNPKTSMGSISGSTMSIQKKPSVIRNPRKIFVVRHGERVDFTFNSWIQHSFDESGQYVRKDLNMPETVPRRKKGKISFFQTPNYHGVGLRIMIKK
jgi:ubiquitin-associated SH3 domain-containing protein